jgi:hypothetical protein
MGIFLGHTQFWLLRCSREKNGGLKMLLAARTCV